MAKLTRRQLAVLAVSSAAAAQTAPAPSPADEDAAARKQVESNSATLAKFNLPMSAEPAFVFRA